MPETASSALTTQGTRLADRVLGELASARVDEWPLILRNLTLADLAPAIRFDAERYTRIPLASSDALEILLMGWLPGQASVVHDHGSCQGAAIVLAGEAREERFTHAGDGLARQERVRTLKRGDATIERATDIHRVSNATTQLLVTMHAYAPRLTTYRTYEAISG